MPLPQHVQDDLDARHAGEAAAARIDTIRDYIWTAAQCAGWCAFGMACISWAVHTTDETYGRAAFAIGLGAGNGGWVFTILAAYRRGERRGDW